jgi:cyclopropane-fatty-acyl-phospholipid synthase
MFGYSHVAEWFVGVVQPLIPEFLIRFFVRLGLYWAVWRLKKSAFPQKELRFVERVHGGELGDKVAVKTEAANEQHYEVPTAFFVNHLSSFLKYSSSEWPKGCNNLEEAELFTLKEYGRHLKLDEVPEGGTVLEVGNGWGSLSLFNAKTYPKLKFMCFSNSQTQIEHIRKQAAERGLNNLIPFCLDINTFCFQEKPGLDLSVLNEQVKEQARARGIEAKATDEKGVAFFDRVVSIECLEHSCNYARIFKRLADCLKKDGLMFVQILGHREYTYFMSNDSWMGRNFFTGGTIPSTKLFLHFNRDLIVRYTKVISGKEYSRSLDAWLHRMEAKKDIVLAIFKEGYKGFADKGREYTPAYMYQKWRMFYIMSSEAFGLNNGQEWMVAYYVFEKR